MAQMSHVVVVVVSGGQPKKLRFLSGYGCPNGFSPHPVSILMLLLLAVKHAPYGRFFAESQKLLR